MRCREAPAPHRLRPAASGVAGHAGAPWAASRGPDRTSTGAELEALDLAGGRLGQIAHEFDPAWILVGCDLVSHEALELVGQRRRGAGRLFEYDERLRLDQPIAVFLADDGDFQHGRVLDQRGLDLDRRDPDTADLQHVIGAAGVPEVTVLVLPILVAGLDPRTEERLLGLVVHGSRPATSIGRTRTVTSGDRKS